MTCKDFEDILSDYLENALPESIKAAAKQHLAGCHACRRMLEDVSWVISQCEGFPALIPPAQLNACILEKTSLRKTWWDASGMFPLLSSWKKTPFAYSLSFAILILLAVSVLFNAMSLFKGANKQIHQLYSSGVKIYYETEKLKEEFSALKEDFPNRIDSGIVKSIDWIKDKMQKEEKKEEKKKEAKDVPYSDCFLA